MGRIGFIFLAFFGVGKLYRVRCALLSFALYFLGFFVPIVYVLDTRGSPLYF